MPKTMHARHVKDKTPFYKEGNPQHIKNERAEVVSAPKAVEDQEYTSFADSYSFPSFPSAVAIVEDESSRISSAPASAMVDDESVPMRNQAQSPGTAVAQWFAVFSLDEVSPEVSSDTVCVEEMGQSSSAAD